MPTAKIGKHIASLFHFVRCSIWKISAMIRRAERNAVSPEVIGAATTPKTVKIPPTTPSVVPEISFTAQAALLPCSAKACDKPFAPPKKAIAIAAQIRAMIDSDIIAP